ncbi:uncharacterized protein LOC112681816 [Sipha flava]|uniref:Uncharacterized protein LOC112681816 n=1 Tax=Sipha flava TaxID=143950 RepID=A0A8B8FBD0_9HEMI|nr:uncharacterized protein LOC112681816 [Sipha flava]
MDKCVDKSLTSNNLNFVIDNNEPCNTEKCEIIPIESNGYNKDRVKKSQLLSPDGWENYQKEFIQSCFKFWEVNETQFQVDKTGLEADLANDSELQTPFSLFANENNKEIINDFNSNKTSNNAIDSEALRTKECIDIIDHSSKSKQKGHNDFKINDNVVDNRGNKGFPRKKMKKFSFYKHTNLQTKSNEKVQPLSFDRYASYTSDDVWAYKIWLESVEKIKKHKLNVNITKGNNEKNSNYVKYDTTNNDDKYYLDIEVRQMEQKVQKLIKSLKEKNKLFTNVDVNERTSKFRSSNKLKYFFKSAFRGNQNEFDRQILDDYTKYINRKLHTWQTLLHCLNDIRQRESCSINTSNLPEDTIKYKFIEHDCNEKVMYDYDGDNLKSIAINQGLNGMGKQKSNKFIKLLSKTKSTMDLRSTVKRMDHNSFNSIRVDQWSSNQINEKIDICKLMSGVNCNVNRPKHNIWKSLSDTDLSTMRSYTDYDEKSIGSKTMRTISRKTLTPEMLIVDDEDNRHWDDMARGLWEEQQECFHTVRARLEYVGSTFTEQNQLIGLKTLCKVDVLARLGHSAEAVDLFVSTLPLSNNPDLMIQKAKAAYDWKFYCHLSIWHHSYRD